jgi:hypothetical protein
VHLNQFEYPLPGLLQLKVQFLELIFVEGQLVPASFKRRRAAKPIIVFFYIEGIHGHALLITGCIYSNRGEGSGRG